MEIIDKTYKAYDTPKDGLFNVEDGGYDPKIGWTQKQVTHRIVGENDLWYVYRFIESDTHYPAPDFTPVKIDFLSPIGIHKTRFVKWLDTQLELF
jgi:hypothetical protein